MGANDASNQIGSIIDINGVAYTIQGDAPKVGRYHAMRRDDDGDVSKVIWIQVRRKRMTIGDWEEVSD